MNQRLDAVSARKYTGKNGEEKTSYTRIGVAWPFRDKEGFTVRLDAMPAPTDGEFTILLFPPKPSGESDFGKSAASDDFGGTDLNDEIPF